MQYNPDIPAWTITSVDGDLMVADRGHELIPPAYANWTYTSADGNTVESYIMISYCFSNFNFLAFSIVPIGG